MSVREKDWFVYLLRCADRTLYCGMTGDLDARIAAHNAGRGGRFTRAKCRRPVELIVACRCPSKTFALQLEAAVKRKRREDKELFLACVASVQRPSLPLSESERRDFEVFVGNMGRGK